MPMPLSLTDKQHRQRDRLVGGPLRGVERTLRGRMIGRGIAERAEDDPIVGQCLVLGRLPACEADRVSRAHCLRQMAGDRRGLRGMASAFEPSTLWRPPEIGSSDEQAKESSMSQAMDWPRTCAARWIWKAASR